MPSSHVVMAQSGGEQSDAATIAKAVSAAPPEIGNHATVMGAGPDGQMKQLRAGTNGWVCMVDPPPSFARRPAPRPSHRQNSDPAASRLLSRLSRPRMAAPRLAAIDCGVRPPVKAGGGSDRANKWLCLSYPQGHLGVV
jgi:hypothetical protein